MNQIIEFLNYAAVSYHPAFFALIIILLSLLGIICLIPICFLLAYIGDFLQQQFPTLKILFIELDQLDDYFYKQNFNKQSRSCRLNLSVTDELEIKLLNLCQGDKERARSLYRYTKERYPGQDKKWYLEEIISSLRREQKTSNPKLSAKKSTASKPSVLECKILRLIQGDRELAIRLLKHAKAKNPGQSYEWYLQKVLWDLERDRRI